MQTTGISVCDSTRTGRQMASNKTKPRTCVNAKCMGGENCESCINRNRIARDAYNLIQYIEGLGCSDKWTEAVMKVQEFAEMAEQDYLSESVLRPTAIDKVDVEALSEAWHNLCLFLEMVWGPKQDWEAIQRFAVNCMGLEVGEIQAALTQTTVPAAVDREAIDKHATHYAGAVRGEHVAEAFRDGAKWALAQTTKVCPGCGNNPCSTDMVTLPEEDTSTSEGTIPPQGGCAPEWPRPQRKSAMMADLRERLSCVDASTPEGNKEITEICHEIAKLERHSTEKEATRVEMIPLESVQRACSNWYRFVEQQGGDCGPRELVKRCYEFIRRNLMQDPEGLSYGNTSLQELKVFQQKDTSTTPDLTDTDLCDGVVELMLEASRKVFECGTVDGPLRDYAERIVARMKRVPLPTSHKLCKTCGTVRVPGKIPATPPACPDCGAALPKDSAPRVKTGYSLEQLAKIELAFFNHDGPHGDAPESDIDYQNRRKEWASFKKDLLSREQPNAEEKK